MNTIYKISFLLVLVFALFGCKKDKDDNTPVQVDVPLDEAVEEAIAAAHDTLFRLEDIILGNGQDVRTFLQQVDPQFLIDNPSGKKEAVHITPQGQKDLWLARLIARGNYLVDDSKHTHPDQGSGKPAQTGLAYSWGSKDPARRQSPPGPGAECTEVQVYGLDCSGMVWQMTNAAGAPPADANNFFVAYISDANKWTTAFKNSTDYKDLVMLDKGFLTMDKIEDGDVILWNNAYGDHVGIYLKGYMYQSNGNVKKQKCYSNRNRDKGPRCVSLSNILSWGLGPYKVLRPAYNKSFKLVYKNEFGYAGTYGGCQVWDYSDSSYVIFHIDPREVNNTHAIVMDGFRYYPSTFTLTPQSGCTCTDLGYPIGLSHIDSIGGFYYYLVHNSDTVDELSLDVYINEGSPAYSSVCNGTPDNGTDSFTRRNFGLNYNTTDSVQDGPSFTLYKLN